MQVLGVDAGRADGALEPVREALGRGELVVVPTDTVYGLAAAADDRAAVERMYRLKGRDPGQPTAVVFGTLAQLEERLPGLPPRARWAVTSLLPGPWTLVLDVTDVPWPWLTGGEPAPIGVRVPAGALELPPIAATSANLAGEPTAATIGELSPALVEQVSWAVDAGSLPPAQESTVLDLVGWTRGEREVRALRDTAGRLAQALAVLDGAPPA